MMASMECTTCWKTFKSLHGYTRHQRYSLKCRKLTETTPHQSEASLPPSLTGIIDHDSLSDSSLKGDNLQAAGINNWNDDELQFHAKTIVPDMIDTPSAEDPLPQSTFKDTLLSSSNKSTANTSSGLASIRSARQSNSNIMRTVAYSDETGRRAGICITPDNLMEEERDSETLPGESKAM